MVEAAHGAFKLPPPVLDVQPGATISHDDFRKTVKAEARVKDEIESDYAGDQRRVVDLVRASTVFETPAQLSSALAQLTAAGSPLRLVRVKDHFNKPVSGYRDLMLNITLAGGSGGGHVAKLQMHLKAIIAIKETADLSYAIGRGLDFDPH